MIAVAGQADIHLPVCRVQQQSPVANYAEQGFDAFRDFPFQACRLYETGRSVLPGKGSAGLVASRSAIAHVGFQAVAAPLRCQAHFEAVFRMALRGVILTHSQQGAVPLPPVLVDHRQRLLVAFGWHGRWPGDGRRLRLPPAEGEQKAHQGLLACRYLARPAVFRILSRTCSLLSP